MSSIGISMGDPAGIGYEITAKALLSGKVPIDNVSLIGNQDAFFKTVDRYSLDKNRLKQIEFFDVSIDEFDFDSMKFGIAQAPAGAVALKTLEVAVRLASEGKVEGICTAPLNRDSLVLAGSNLTDGTSILTALTSSSDVTTVYEVQKLRTILLSRHVSMIEAVKQVTKENIKKYIRYADLTLRLLGIKNRKIAVAALNPHGGDGGRLGDTEDKEITPAIQEASKEYEVYGPIPADVVYRQALGGSYGIVLSLYHDQAHIVMKALDFYRTIDLTVGLPFLRVAVDHGPGLDRAGQGTGIETNMIVAIQKSLEYSSVYGKEWLKSRHG